MVCATANNPLDMYLLSTHITIILLLKVIYYTSFHMCLLLSNNIPKRKQHKHFFFFSPYIQTRIRRSTSQRQSYRFSYYILTYILFILCGFQFSKLTYISAPMSVYLYWGFLMYVYVYTISYFRLIII